MKTIYLAAAAACALFAAEAPKTFTGVITDTMCGANPHSKMMKDKTDPECVSLCTRGSSQYALVEGAAVMKLSDQKTSAKFAGRKVKVTGSFDEKSKTIKVASIEPDNDN